MRRDGEKVSMAESESWHQVVLESQLPPCPYPTLVGFSHVQNSSDQDGGFINISNILSPCYTERKGKILHLLSLHMACASPSLNIDCAVLEGRIVGG